MHKCNPRLAAQLAGRLGRLALRPASRSIATSSRLSSCQPPQSTSTANRLLPRPLASIPTRPVAVASSRRSDTSAQSSQHRLSTGPPPFAKMKVSCQCGTVSFETPTATPLGLYHCHCSECQKQSSSAFGTSAVFPAEGLFPLPVELEEKLAVYTRPGSRVKSGRDMKCYFCKVCGSRIMNRQINTDGTFRETVSIKGGLVEGLDWSNGKHIYTDSAVIEIPEGKEQYPGTPTEMEGRPKNV